MTATGHYTYTIGQGYCTLHGYYWGNSCPSCVSVIYPPVYPATVTTAPSSTEEALAATVKVLTQLINDLREQVAARDRQIEELKADLEER